MEERKEDDGRNVEEDREDEEAEAGGREEDAEEEEGVEGLQTRDTRETSPSGGFCESHSWSFQFQIRTIFYYIYENMLPLDFEFKHNDIYCLTV